MQLLLRFPSTIPRLIEGLWWNRIAHRTVLGLESYIERRVVDTYVNNPVHVKRIHGFEIYLNPHAEYISPLIAVAGIWELATTDLFIELLRKGDESSMSEPTLVGLLFSPRGELDKTELYYPSNRPRQTFRSWQNLSNETNSVMSGCSMKSCRTLMVRGHYISLGGHRRRVSTRSSGVAEEKSWPFRRFGLIPWRGASGSIALMS